MPAAPRPPSVAELLTAVLTAVLAAGVAAAEPASTPAERAFLRDVAPVLAQRCLGCHGPTSRQGGLDLSHRDRLAAGGVNGPALTAGHADDSPLWQYVEADAMPPDGPPLSDAEKKTLKDWIDAGAAWPEGRPWAVLRASDAPAAGAGWVRRLTTPEYAASVEAVTGVDLSADAAALLPRDLRADGFHNTAYNLGVDLAHVRAYAELARRAVTRADLPTVLAEHAEGETVRERVAALGAVALRGPLSAEETASFLTVAEAAAAEGADETEALGWALEAMLQSPRFLYRIERQRGPGETRPVSGHELAARLSYLLWGGPPDAALKAAADRGDLAATPAGRAAAAAQVARMLDDPRARRRSGRFAHEWLNLDRLEALDPAADRFPNWDPALAADMAAETRGLFDHVAWHADRPLTALLTEQTGFLTPRLADHYGLDWGRLAGAATLSAVPTPAGALAVYDFAAAPGESGVLIRDRSGHAEPLDLRVEEGSDVTPTPGGLRVDGPSRLIAVGNAGRLTRALRTSGEITIEAWVTPADAVQKGPARIVTLSDGANRRNVTLGQDGGRFDARLRTTVNTDRNGLPSAATDPGAARPGRPVHLVFTRARAGLARVWVDGAVRGNRNTEGGFGNWEDGFALALANEVGADRPWRGVLHRVTILDRALTPAEVAARAATPWRADLSAEPARGGLLTQGAALTVGGDEASTVSRGLFVLRDLLLGDVSDPPPGVDTTPVPAEPGLSQRTIAEGRLADASCAGCHEQFEPFAFAFERYDGLGAFRTTDRHGNALRSDGTVRLPGGEEATFATTDEFLALIAAGEPVRRGLTRKLTQFALGRPLSAADEPAVQAIHDAAWAADAPRGPGSYRSLMTAIALSELTLTAPVEPADDLSDAGPPDAGPPDAGAPAAPPTADSPPDEARR